MVETVEGVHRNRDDHQQSSAERDAQEVSIDDARRAVALGGEYLLRGRRVVLLLGRSLGHQPLHGAQPLPQNFHGLGVQVRGS